MCHTERGGVGGWATWTDTDALREYNYKVSQRAAPPRMGHPPLRPCHACQRQMDPYPPSLWKLVGFFERRQTTNSPPRSLITYSSPAAGSDSRSVRHAACRSVYELEGRSWRMQSKASRRCGVARSWAGSRQQGPQGRPLVSAALNTCEWGRGCAAVTQAGAAGTGRATGVAGTAIRGHIREAGMSG